MFKKDLNNFNMIGDEELIKTFKRTKNTSLNRLIILTEIKNRGLQLHIHKKNLVIFKLRTPILPGFSHEPETYPLLLFYLVGFFLSVGGLNSQFKHQFLVMTCIFIFLLCFRILALDLSHELLITEFRAIKIGRLFRIFPLSKKIVPLGQSSGFLVTSSFLGWRYSWFSARIFLRTLQKNTKAISFISEHKSIFILSKFLNDYFDAPEHPVFVDQIPSGLPEMVNADLQFIKYPYYYKIFRPSIKTRSFKDFCLSIARLDNEEKQKEDIDSEWLGLIQHVVAIENGLARSAIPRFEEKNIFVEDSWLMQYPASLFIPKQDKYSNYSRVFSSFKIIFTSQGILVLDSNGFHLDSSCYSDIEIPPATIMEDYLYLELNEQIFMFKIDGSFPVKEIILWFKSLS